jgi:hypothetical protein
MAKGNLTTRCSRPQARLQATAGGSGQRCAPAAAERER